MWDEIERREIDVIASTLREFLDWAKILYQNKSNSDVACEIGEIQICLIKYVILHFA